MARCCAELRGACVVAILLLVQAHVPASAIEKSNPVTVFDRADFLLSKERRPPADASMWKSVSLPDQWRHRMPPVTEAQGWYRIKFWLEKPSPSSVHTVAITHPRANRTDFFVNGKVIGGAGDLISSPASRTNRAPSFGTPLHLTVAPKLLRAGENTIHVRVHATSAGTLMHGLPQVVFGEATELRKMYIASSDAGFYAQRIFFAMALTSGIITFFLWLARRDDPVMFWYSAACLGWGLVSIPRLGLRWVDYFNDLIPVLVWFLHYALVVPIVVLCLRSVNVKWLGFEVALWLYLAIEISFPLWAPGGQGQWRVVWDAANTALLVTAIGIVLLHARRPMRWSLRLQVAALIAMAIVMFVEVMRYMGWVYIDLKAVRHYHVPLMLLAIGAVIFERHVFAVRQTEQANLELEERVAVRSQEIEADYVRLERAMREQALAQQREHILADMYDGLGASLIGLLRQVQSDGTNRPGIRQRIQEALLEMRAAVDTLEPRASDLATVLDKMHYRLDDLILGTGIALIWEVDKLSSLTSLNPATIFELQRILLEAVTNVLKHAGARRIRVYVGAPSGPRVRIEIEDDGCGFDSQQGSTGRGLANMRARSARIGATLEISSRVGAGTAIRLLLAVALVGAEPEERGGGRLQAAGITGTGS